MLMLTNSVSIVAGQSKAVYFMQEACILYGSWLWMQCSGQGKRYALQLLPVIMLKYMNNKYKLNNTSSKKHKTQVKYFYIHYKFQDALNFSRMIAA